MLFIGARFKTHEALDELGAQGAAVRPFASGSRRWQVGAVCVATVARYPKRKGRQVAKVLLPAAVALLAMRCAPHVVAPPVSDHDGDLINDGQDACPDTAGLLTEDAKTSGCPPPPDQDRDKILDVADACPTEPGEASDDASMNGCPDVDHDDVVDHNDICPSVPGLRTGDTNTNGCPDSDRDGVVDERDACPDRPGIAAADGAKNGCPLPADSDGDGIADAEDACPNLAGARRANLKQSGCPNVQPKTASAGRAPPR